jgi:hypothetical protein
MVYSQSPPLVEKEWLTAEETSSDSDTSAGALAILQRLGRS